MAIGTEEFELEPGEKITRSVRQHWLVFVGTLLPFVLLAILPWLATTLILAIAGHVPTTQNFFATVLTTNNPLTRFVLGLWWLFVWMGAYSVMTRYFLTAWVITTTRIVDIHQWGFFNRKVSSFLLSRVQDVTTDVSGFFNTIFGFGTLNVETAGRDEKFEMHGIANPEGLRDLIMREVADLNQPGTQAQGV